MVIGQSKTYFQKRDPNRQTRIQGVDWHKVYYGRKSRFTMVPREWVARPELPKPIVMDVSKKYPYLVRNRVYYASSGLLWAAQDTPSSQTVTHTKNGVTNPMWKEQIRMGLNAATPYTMTKTSIVEEDTWASLQYASGGQLYLSFIEGSLNDPGFTSMASLESVAEQRARIVFYNKLRKRQNVAQGQIFLGELRETIHQIRNPFKTLGERFLGHFERLKKAGRLTKVYTKHRWDKILGDSWLEFSFGIAPLLSDIDDGVRALARLHSKVRLERVRAVAGAENSTCIGTVERMFRDVSYRSLYYDVTIIDSGKWEVAYVAGLETGVQTAPIDSVSFSDMTHALGFTLKEFVPTMYELMPWSFLIDYFTTVGTVVNAWALSTSRIKWYVKTVTSEVTRTQSGHFDFARFAAENVQGSGKGVLGNTRTIAKSMVRSIPSGVSLPDLAFNLNMSPFKGLNLLALRTNMTSWGSSMLHRAGR